MEELSQPAFSMAHDWQIGSHVEWQILHSPSGLGKKHSNMQTCSGAQLTEEHLLAPE